MFGDPEVLPVKVIWDYTYYWGVLAQFFFQRRLTDLARASVLRAELAHASRSTCEVQALLRAWSAADRGEASNPRGDARPGGAAVVRRTQPQPERPPRRRRVPRAHPLFDAADALARGEIALRATRGGVDSGTLRRLLDEGSRFGLFEDSAAPMLFAAA